MKTAFFGIAAVAALALTSGTASAHPPGYYYGGPVIVRPAPVFLPPPPVFVNPQPAFGFGGNSFSFGVARPGFSFGFSTGPTFNSYPSYSVPLYSYPSYGYRGYGYRW